MERAVAHTVVIRAPAILLLDEAKGPAAQLLLLGRRNNCRICDRRRDRAQTNVVLAQLNGLVLCGAEDRPVIEPQFDRASGRNGFGKSTRRDLFDIRAAAVMQYARFALDDIDIAAYAHALFSCFVSSDFYLQIASLLSRYWPIPWCSVYRSSWYRDRRSRYPSQGG